MVRKFVTIIINFSWKANNVQLLIQRQYVLQSLGVKSLPALLTTGLSLADIGCESYELSTCEPLHDLMTMIYNILQELPAHVETKMLKEEIKTVCDGIIGRWLNM